MNSITVIKHVEKKSTNNKRPVVVEINKDKFNAVLKKKYLISIFKKYF